MYGVTFSWYTRWNIVQQEAHELGSDQISRGQAAWDKLFEQLYLLRQGDVSPLQPFHMMTASQAAAAGLFVA